VIVLLQPFKVCNYIGKKNDLQSQAASGNLFGTFLALHLTNHATAIFGHLLYDGVLEFFRLYYQHPIVEPSMFILSLCVNRCSIARISCCTHGHKLIKIPQTTKARRKTREHSFNLFPNLTIKHSSLCRVHEKNATLLTFSYILSAFIFGHVGATRIVPLLYNIPVDFGFLSFALEYSPLIFYPYYITFAASGLYHITYGSIQAARVANFKVTTRYHILLTTRCLRCCLLERSHSGPSLVLEP
jgi:hypothetical protein